MDTAKPQNPCTDLSEIRRWGAEGWEKGFAVSLFVSKVPRHINEKNNRKYNLEVTETGRRICEERESFTNICQDRMFRMLSSFTEEELENHIRIQNMINEAYKEDIRQSLNEAEEK